MSKTVFSCKRCGKAIFRGDQVKRVQNLWDLGEYRPDCYVLSGAVDLGALRRYDCSLHEGWYCCRFIAMRMTEDKFGTGRDLLVYCDSVVEHDEGRAAPVVREPVAAQTRLSARDFDAVLSAEPEGALSVVKFGAIWCPPCRLMDAVIGRIEASGGLDGVRFFEVDVDEERALAARFPSRSVPTFVFFHRGKPLSVRGGNHPNGFSGAMPSAAFSRLCADLRASLRRPSGPLARA